MYFLHTSKWKKTRSLNPIRIEKVIEKEAGLEIDDDVKTKTTIQKESVINTTDIIIIITATTLVMTIMNDTIDLESLVTKNETAKRKCVRKSMTTIERNDEGEKERGIEITEIETVIETIEIERNDEREKGIEITETNETVIKTTEIMVP